MSGSGSTPPPPHQRAEPTRAPLLLCALQCGVGLSLNSAPQCLFSVCDTPTRGLRSTGDPGPHWPLTRRWPWASQLASPGPASSGASQASDQRGPGCGHRGVPGRQQLRPQRTDGGPVWQKGPDWLSGLNTGNVQTGVNCAEAGTGSEQPEGCGTPAPTGQGVHTPSRTQAHGGSFPTDARKRHLISCPAGPLPSAEKPAPCWTLGLRGPS